MPKTSYPSNIVINVTEQHFERAVPGDPCHCTIGEATHDALNAIMPSLGLESVDAASISVNPATVNDEPCVGVTFIGVSTEGQDVNVQFLLEQASAFKVAYTTDNRQTGYMKRSARKHPYALRASKIRMRKRRERPEYKPDAAEFDPKAHVRQIATDSAQKSSSVKEAQTRALEKLESNPNRTYKVTPALRKLAKERAASSFANKGSRAGRIAPVKVYRNRRFHG